MQKRDKSGRFLKKKVCKKASKKGPKKVAKQAQKPLSVQTHKAYNKVGDLSLFDLQDMIQAEVSFQLKAW